MLAEVLIDGPPTRTWSCPLAGTIWRRALRLHYRARQQVLDEYLGLLELSHVRHVKGRRDMELTCDSTFTGPSSAPAPAGHGAHYSRIILASTMLFPWLLVKMKQ